MDKVTQEHYKWLGQRGGKKSKRKPDTVASLSRRIQVVAENEGVEVKITVHKR